MSTAVKTSTKRYHWCFVKEYHILIILCGMETEVSEVFFRLSIPHTSHGGQCPISLWQKAQSSKGAKENLNKIISLKEAQAM